MNRLRKTDRLQTAAPGAGGRMNQHTAREHEQIKPIHPKTKSVYIGVSPSWEIRTASSRGRYGGRRQHDPCLKHTYKNTTCWPATAYDITAIYHSIKGRRENTSSTSFSEACIRSMAQRLENTVSRSPLGEPWLHK